MKKQYQHLPEKAMFIQSDSEIYGYRAEACREHVNKSSFSFFLFLLTHGFRFYENISLSLLQLLRQADNCYGRFWCATDFNRTKNSVYDLRMFLPVAVFPYLSFFVFELFAEYRHFVVSFRWNFFVKLS